MFVYSCLKALTLQSAVVLGCQCNRLFLLLVSPTRSLFFPSFYTVSSTFQPFSAFSCWLIFHPCALSLLNIPLLSVTLYSSVILNNSFLCLSPLSFISIGSTGYILNFCLPLSFLSLLFWHSMKCGQILMSLISRKCAPGSNSFWDRGTYTKGHILHSEWTRPLKSTESYVSDRVWEEKLEVIVSGLLCSFHIP